MSYRSDKSSGFTLIGNLIAALTPATGIVKSTSLQTTGHRNAGCTNNPRQALQFGNDLDRMRVNIAGVAAFTTHLRATSIKSTSLWRKPVKSLGFTLVELMVTVAIIGIVTSLGVPNFLEMMRQNSATSLANELASSLNLARSEAIKRGTQVTVCKSANITNSSPTCSTTANWQDGWLIFVDKGTSGTYDNATDIRLKVGQPSNSSAVISADSTFSNYVAYLPSGMSKGSGLPNGSLDICVGDIQRSIILNTTGRIRFSKGTC